jgi:hypothetical protein
MQYGAWLLVAGACGFVIGCGGAGESALRPEPLSVSSYGGTSTPSGASGSFGPRGPAASAGHTDEGAGILASPDLVEVPFAISVEGEGGAAIAALEPEARAVAERIKAATGRPVSTRMKTMRFENVAYAKMESPRRQTIAEGCVEVDVSKDTDFWARARVLASISAAAPADHVVTKETHRTTFGSAIPRVRDPEVHRKALVERWMERSRGFIDASGAGPMRLSDCAPPVEIRQSPVGTDQVLLSLPASCKLASGEPPPRSSDAQR